MIWYDMIWYDMIWYDMIWYDMIMIWYMIWCDMIYWWYDKWYNTSHLVNSEIRCVSAIAYLLTESWCCLYKAPTFFSHNTKETIS